MRCGTAIVNGFISPCWTILVLLYGHLYEVEFYILFTKLRVGQQKSMAAWFYASLISRGSSYRSGEGISLILGCVHAVA